MRATLSLLLALIVLMPSAGVLAVASPHPHKSRAVGSPNTGHLERGKRLEPSSAIYFKWGSPPAERYGTDELVAMLDRAANAVASKFPGTKTTMGDLSRENGGPMRPHASHRNGRDADIGFYFRDRRGRSVRVHRFYEVRPNLTAGATLRFDTARNWALVEALVTDPGADVHFILVAAHIEQALLAEGRRQGASAAVRREAAHRLYQARSGGEHDDHFHLRILCPATDRPACVD